MRGAIFNDLKNSGYGYLLGEHANKLAPKLAKARCRQESRSCETASNFLVRILHLGLPVEQGVALFAIQKYRCS
jgi:hypothetical protein